MNGSVNPLYEPAMTLMRAGVVPGHDLTTESALAKLSYLLSIPSLDTENVVGQMSLSLRGELTEQKSMVFEHPQSILPPPLENLAGLAYAISKGNVSEVQEILKGDLGWLLKEADYSGNTPLVSHFRSTHIQFSSRPGSTSQQEDRILIYSTCSLKMVLPSICVITTVGHRCSWLLVLDSPTTFQF